MKQNHLLSDDTISYLSILLVFSLLKRLDPAVFLSFHPFRRAGSSAGLISIVMQLSTELGELKVWPINYFFPTEIEDRMTGAPSYSQIQKHKL